MLLNETEQVMIKLHRNDRWQDRVEGGFASVVTAEDYPRKRGRNIIRGQKEITEQHRARSERLKEVLQPR